LWDVFDDQPEIPAGGATALAKSSQNGLRKGFAPSRGRQETNDERSRFHSVRERKKAEEVRDKILGMQKEYLIEVGDAVIATRDENGRVKLNQLMHPAATGAVSGALWGMLIGWLFLMPVAGAAVGAASGALGGSLAVEPQQVVLR
jgi:hypothetical protein